MHGLFPVRPTGQVALKRASLLDFVRGACYHRAREEKIRALGQVMSSEMVTSGGAVEGRADPAGTATTRRLQAAYADRIRVNPHLTRSLVRFQANKDRPVYRWFKYKEGFSSELVGYLLGSLAARSGTLLDPFAGSGAALFASRDLGWDAVGIEVLPVGWCVAQARLSAEEVPPESFAREVERACEADFGALCPAGYSFPHIRITAGAFSKAVERGIGGFLRYCGSELKDAHVRRLFHLACMAILEEVSYTRKDGQYLRWDPRGRKVRAARPFDKGRIPPFGAAVRRKLRQMRDDICSRDADGLFPRRAAGGALDMRMGSCLEVLPGLAPESVDFVLTSPPYCNRYDYTRTYALELAFLGHTDTDVKALRQRLLSCTVENKEKVAELRGLYERLGRADAFREVSSAFERQEALQEVLAWLDNQRDDGRLNNANIARMVRNYFFEMAFVAYELARVLRPGGTVAMVNDNVRYAGREIAVDIFLSESAAAFGLEVETVWTLPRGKGNSSQQMGEHGRTELRKCVYVWRKPTSS